MAFQFTEEDFRRYVKMDEHGGRHIWHDLQDRLQEEFGVPFSAEPYVARGDRLRTIWFAPVGTPRGKWEHQAQFHLARSLDKKSLHFGLTVECATQPGVEQYNCDPDLDGSRLVERLANDPGFVATLDALVRQPDWRIWAEEKESLVTPNGAELLKVVQGYSGRDYWSVGIERVLSAEEAIAAGEQIVDVVMEAYRQVRPLWEEVIPPADRAHLGGYATSTEPESPPTMPKPRPPKPPSLADFFAAHGLYFTPLTLATYFTALQTKGFVILSGLSGTGKTRLAQHFAGLLESSTQGGDNYLFLSVRPDWRDSRPLLGYYNPLTAQYETSELLRFILDARHEESAPRLARLPDWLAHEYQTKRVQDWLSHYRQTRERLAGLPADRMSGDDLHLLWQERSNGVASVGQAAPVKASEEQLREATRLAQDMERSRGQRLIKTINYIRDIPGNVTPWARSLRALAAFDPISTIADRSVLRKVLSFLGYERSFRLHGLVDSGDTGAVDHAFAFLEQQVSRISPAAEPLQRALTPWLVWEFMQTEDEGETSPTMTPNPYFVLLDEMNISHVEYYFADFLSVLESGRDPDGYTRETVKLHSFPESAKDEAGVPKPHDSHGRYIPPELHLPPNLYIVGTVNVDETTHAFSPKVLDRAFTIEMAEVDFGHYLAHREEKAGDEALHALRDELLPIFARKGQFGVVSKAKIGDFVAAHPEYLAHLEQLKALLLPFDLHFGYRVFDEIMAFCANAKANGLWVNLGGMDAAFDRAVLMKVLPKFHGPRSKLAEPLQHVLGWAQNPADPQSGKDQVAEETKDAASSLQLRQALEASLAGGGPSTCRYPHTAHKAVRMIQALHALGFASFA